MCQRACMFTGSQLSRNLNSKITVNAWRIAVGSRHSVMRIQEYSTTHVLATRRGFTNRLCGLPKHTFVGQWKPACTVRGTPPFPESRRVLCVITGSNNWTHYLRHNCNKSSVHWTLPGVCESDDQELTLGYHQQDGATSHTSGMSIAEVVSFFPDRVISRGLGPPRSPDLTPPDFFLWGHLKGRAYMTYHAHLMNHGRTSGARSRRWHQRFWKPPSETCNVVFSCVMTLREDISRTSCDSLILYMYAM
jgi:hypothetical protein